MIIVTGSAGFIGSNIIKALNKRGIKDILAIDDLTDGVKYKNLVDCEIVDYWDKEVFLEHIRLKKIFPYSIKAIFHQGACSTTTEWNGKFMMENNYEYSKYLLQYCLDYKIPFIYASSAAVYGGNQIFKESREFESPLNVYGYSKFLFDQYVRGMFPSIKSQVAGFRYFNVYGQGEQHKGSMASVALHLYNQLHQNSVVKLFEGSGGYNNGEQRRDFVYVDDVVKVNLWFLDHPHISGIFNVGTGQSQTFNDVANAVINWYGRGEVRYIPFPAHLLEHYQSFTEADISALRNVGYKEKFKSVEEGVTLYLNSLRNMRPI